MTVELVKDVLNIDIYDSYFNTFNETIHHKVKSVEAAVLQRLSDVIQIKIQFVDVVMQENSSIGEEVHCGYHTIFNICDEIGIVDAESSASGQVAAVKKLLLEFKQTRVGSSSFKLNNE
jgi:hypothetical protein